MQQDTTNSIEPALTAPVATAPEVAMKVADIAVDRAVTASAPGLAYFDDAARAPAVLFAHGVGSSAATWRELFTRLPGYRLIASDMRGHGRSSVPAGPYTLDDLVRDQVRVMDELALDTVHFVGFSIGALIGQALALAHPQRVASLTLLSGITGRTPEEAARAAARLEVIRSSAPADVARGSVARWFTPAFAERRPGLVADEVAIVSATDPLGYAASYEVLAGSDLIDRIHAIAVPTLVATGEHDIGSTPRMSARMHERIAGSRLTILPGLKHYIHIEGSDAVADLLAGFLGEVATAQDPLATPNGVRDDVFGSHATGAAHPHRVSKKETP